MNRSTSETESPPRRRALWRERRGATAVEFAFLLPILLMLTLGILELSLVLFDYHRLGEAARRGARTAVVDDPVPSLANLTGGTITCQGGGGGVTCVGGAVASVTSFNNIVAAMQGVMPAIGAQNARVIYNDSGVTSADTPGIVTPTVTVQVIDFGHSYLFLDYVPGVPSTFIFPPFSSSQMGSSVSAI